VNRLPEPRTQPAEDLAAVLHQAGRTLFGATAVVTEVVLRGLSESAPQDPAFADGSIRARMVAAAVLGLGWQAAHVADRVAGRAVRVLAPAAALVLEPPLVARRHQPGYLLRKATLRWNEDRGRAVRSLSQWSASAAPVAGDVVVNMVDLDQLVALALQRMDLQQLAQNALGRLDVDALVNSAMDTIDLPRLLERVTSENDLTPVVEDVVRQMDLAEVVRLALDQIDLTELVLTRVELRRVIDTALDQLDLTALVLERVDLTEVAQSVMDDIDLPEIIRDSTGSMAADTIHGVRLRGVDADRAVSRFVDRLLVRRPQPPTPEPRTEDDR
jgi:hypothetical protein